jgi:hypothetical protein
MFFINFLLVKFIFTEKALNIATIFSKNGNTKSGVDILIQGNGQHLGCGEVILVGKGFN